MRTRLQSILLLTIALAPTQTAFGQDKTIIQELDAYWAEMARSLNEGDHETMTQLYHPDAIWEGGNGDSLSISLEKGPLMHAKSYLDTIVAGKEHAKIEFRFSSRLRDADAAHEIGMIHSFGGKTGSEPVHGYFKLDSYLVKKDGKWVMLIENQTNQVLSEADWNELE